MCDSSDNTRNVNLKELLELLDAECVKNSLPKITDSWQYSEIQDAEKSLKPLKMVEKSESAPQTPEKATSQNPISAIFSGLSSRLSSAPTPTLSQEYSLADLDEQYGPLSPQDEAGKRDKEVIQNHDLHLRLALVVILSLKNWVACLPVAEVVHPVADMMKKKKK